MIRFPYIVRNVKCEYTYNRDGNGICASQNSPYSLKLKKKTKYCYCESANALQCGLNSIYTYINCLFVFISATDLCSTLFMCVQQNEMCESESRIV